MGFGINGHDLPLLRSYKQAKQLHDSIMPIRGSNNLRPLGDRRKQHQRIEGGHAGDVAGVACVLYRTPCVIYYEDGTIYLQHGGYISQSTCKFIERIAPVSNVRMDGQRGCLVVRVAGGDYKCGEDGLWLRYNEQTTGYEPFDCEPFMTTSVNRKAMEQVRQQYAAFMQYAIGLGKLTQWEKPEGEGVPVNAAELLGYMASDDMDKWAMAYRKLIWEAGAVGQNHDYSARMWSTTWHCDQKRVEALLTHYIKKVHAREVLVREALPTGMHKKDPNHNYVRYMREV